MRRMRRMSRMAGGRPCRRGVRSADRLILRWDRGRNRRRRWRRLGGLRREDRRAEVSDGLTGRGGSCVEVGERGALAVGSSTATMRIPRGAQTLLCRTVQNWTAGGNRRCGHGQVGGHRRHDRLRGAGAGGDRGGGDLHVRWSSRDARRCRCRRRCRRRRRLSRRLTVTVHPRVDGCSRIGQVETDVCRDTGDCRLGWFGQGAGGRRSPGSSDQHARGDGCPSDPPARHRRSTSTDHGRDVSGGDHRSHRGRLGTALVHARRGSESRKQGAHRARRRSVIGGSRRHVHQIVRAACGVTRR